MYPVFRGQKLHWWSNQRAGVITRLLLELNRRQFSLQICKKNSVSDKHCGSVLLNRCRPPAVRLPGVVHGPHPLQRLRPDLHPHRQALLPQEWSQDRRRGQEPQGQGVRGRRQVQGRRSDVFFLILSFNCVCLLRHQDSEINQNDTTKQNSYCHYSNTLGCRSFSIEEDLVFVSVAIETVHFSHFHQHSPFLLLSSLFLH